MKNYFYYLSIFLLFCFFSVSSLANVCDMSSYDDNTAICAAKENILRDCTGSQYNLLRSVAQSCPDLGETKTDCAGINHSTGGKAVVDGVVTPHDGARSKAE